MGPISKSNPHLLIEALRALLLPYRLPRHTRGRRQRIEDLANGRLHVLTSCEIISEGVDIPVVSAAILLRPTQSLALALQQMGRALRPYPGKDRALILDHAGNSLRHGLPDADRVWTLEGRKRRGKKNEESALPIRQCEECYHVHTPAPSCPNCGFVYYVRSRRVTEVEGELQQVESSDRVRQRKQEILQHRHEESQCYNYQDFVNLGKARGYKSPGGWAFKRLEARGARARAKRNLGYA